MLSSSSLPEDVTASISDKEELKLLQELVTIGGQSHLLHAFSKSKDRSKLQALAEQLVKLNKGYAQGGLLGYIDKAKKLLEDSRNGVNPLDGWKPSVPKGEKFDLGTEKYDSTEAEGMKLLGKVGFILVAGGLGERLGYNGAKVNAFATCASRMVGQSRDPNSLLPSVSPIR
jgi:UDP-sugar pyrophosphorylase